MAWSTGSQLFEEISSVLRNVSNYADRVDIYRELIPIFENYDADVENCLGCDDAFDEAWNEIYPEQSDDYED